MRTMLSEQERSKLDRLVAETEERTGAQIVLAAVDRSDAYPELPWKAFALGTGLAGAAVTLIDLLSPQWTGGQTVLIALIAALAAGAASALLCVLVPAFARLFLDGIRAKTEVRQYAESLFLSRQVFATSRRTGVLLLVSRFERRAVVLPDSGIAERLSRDARKKLSRQVARTLRGSGAGAALADGLLGLEKALGSGSDGPVKNELPNNVIEREGA